jgi:hypothetical protein
MVKAERVKLKQLMESVRAVLLSEWDPLGVADNPSCRDEYDRYVATACRLLREGADEHKLAAYLSQVQEVAMGLSRVDSERDRSVARRLLALTVPGLTRRSSEPAARAADLGRCSGPTPRAADRNR